MAGWDGDCVSGDPWGSHLAPATVWITRLAAGWWRSAMVGFCFQACGGGARQASVTALRAAPRGGRGSQGPEAGTLGKDLGSQKKTPIDGMF